MTLSLDIKTLQDGYASGRLDPAAALDDVLKRIGDYPDPAVWIERFGKDLIHSQLSAARKRQSQGIAQPLLGIPFAIKDNIDFAGAPTTAACPAFKYVAEQSAGVVQKLCDAGAIAVGKTNLDQFATGLVGTRSPYGACANPFDHNYISGGSSSGSAVAVGAGLVSFALGTDTAGSGRVPAAFNNIVGLKPTRGLLSTAGVVPACKSLDCVSILSLSCDDARTLLAIAGDPKPTGPKIPRSAFRFGVPRDSDLRFFGNTDAEKIYRAAIDRLRNLGGVAVEIDYTPFARAAAMLYAGPWVAERWLVAKDLLSKNPDSILPVTRSIIERGPKFTAADTFLALYELEDLKESAKPQWQKMDLLLLPTTGTIYTLAEVSSDPIGLNSNLGYYTNFVNLMDLCAVAVPSGFQSNGLPAGVSLIGPAGAELSLLEIGDSLHRSLGIGPGLARQAIPEAQPMALAAKPEQRVKLAVVGAHLSGMPLNHQLTDRGALLIRQTRTAPTYRFYALPGTTPPKPGLIRINEGAGASIELEIWEMSAEAFGSFVAAIPAPLGIGTILLEDGTSVAGFLCESYALAGAIDISHFGGWREYVRSR